MQPAPPRCRAYFTYAPPRFTHTGSTDVDAAVALPLIGWLASGLAAVALTPRNRTSQALLAAGLLLVGSWLGEAAATQLDGGTVGGAFSRALTDALFLAGLAAVVTTLATFPDGRFDLRWSRAVTWALFALAAVAPAAQLVGSAELLIGRDPATAEQNLLAVAGLEALGAFGEFIVASEPVWLLLGFALLFERWVRASPARRRELAQPLAALGVPAALLALVVVNSVAGSRIGISVAASRSRLA